VIEVKDCAFADIDEEADVLLAPRKSMLAGLRERKGIIRLTSTYVVVRHQFAGISRSCWVDLALSNKCFVRR